MAGGPRPGSRDNGAVPTRIHLPAPDGRRAAPAILAGLGAALACAAPVLAHGTVAADPPTAGSLALGWSFDPLVWLPALAAILVWRAAVRRVNAAHPGNPVPPGRNRAWYLGIAVVLVALDSGIERYDTSLFSVHMVQHMLLTLVAPPLLLAAGPTTLLLRAAGPDARRRWILPALHSRAMRAVSFPVVAWLLFATVMWASHFSPLFDIALENELAHRFEHALFVGSALLFWWPVVGPDPSPWRLGPAARVLYVGLQMPQNTFLALAIYSATAPLYAHYATGARAWGPSPLEDQQTAGGIMWLGGDLLFLGAVAVLVWAWMRHEDRRTVGEDRRLEGERAAIRAREVRLAARRAAERGEVTAVPAAGPDQPSGGSGAAR